MSSARIVLIEDNELSRTLLRTILRNAGYEVVGEASDGERGVEIVIAHSPDLVCLDVMMPRRDGIEVLAEIRRELPDIPVLMVTGHSDRETVQNVIRQGASGIVVKPFNASRVLAEVARCIGSRK